MIDEKDIVRITEKLDIPMVGILDADPLISSLERLKKRAFTPFCHIEPEKRIDYRSVFPEVKSVIVIGMPYRLWRKPSKDCASQGRIASFCAGKDYHLRMKERLTLLAERLKDQVETLSYQIYVDHAKLVDRAAAWQAGLGFFGKNNLLIHPEYGSAFTIGQLLLDVPISHSSPQPMACLCGSCDRCLKACPSKALKVDGNMETARCLSYLTQKRKLTESETRMIRDYVYGCDLCQLVCPFNENRQGQSGKDPNERWLFPDLEEIMAMDDAAFDAAFRETAIHWRGREILQRNAELVLAHQK